VTRALKQLDFSRFSRFSWRSYHFISDHSNRRLIGYERYHLDEAQEPHGVVYGMLI
jgi:hypothetical protein